VKFHLNLSARLLFVMAAFCFSPFISAQSNQDLEMLAAAKAGNSERARVLLDGASNINLAEADGMNALHYATLNNDAALVGALIRAGADIDSRTRYGITPIYLTARNGSAEITQALLDAGADANEVFNEGETVLMTAARTGDVDTLKVLLDAGAIVDAREDWHGQTSLMWAAAQKHPEAIALLVEHGADIKASSALEEWERQITMEPRDKWLPPGAMTPLHFAAREGCLDCISTLLDLGAEIDAVTPKDITPLLMAIINGHYDVAWVLIEADADIHLSDDTNRSPLYAAVNFNIMPESNRPSPYVIPNERTAYELMQNLLARGANVNQQLTSMIPYRLKLDRGNDSMLTAGTTAFLRAAKSADIAAMKLLLEYSADPFLSTQQGINPLMTAANHGTKESDTTGRYKTAAEMNEAIQICLDQGLDINAKDNQGKTAVFGAATFGLTEVVEYLHDKGAIVNYEDNNGISPLQAAMGQAGGYGFVGRDGVFHEDTVALIQNFSN
jgi:uncharacterized protein